MLQIITTKEDFREIALEMYRLAAEHHQSAPPEIKPDIMTGEQVCQKLSISIQTLQKWRAKGRIPYLEIGGSIRYDFNKVLAALEVVKKKGSVK